MESIHCVDWGLIDYATAYERQKQLFEQALENKKNGLPVENTLIFCEHPPVITVGKSGNTQNLLFSEDFLTARGVSLYHIDRGGDVTFHGPGQLVGYPIFDIEQMELGLKAYISRMEDAIISLLSYYGISGERMDSAPGVWLDPDKPGSTRKICAIGVRSSKFITMHGFALNISPDLEYFNLINPCGFTDKGVTSMEKELDKTIDTDHLKKRLTNLFLEKFAKS